MEADPSSKLRFYRTPKLKKVVTFPALSPSSNTNGATSPETYPSLPSTPSSAYTSLRDILPFSPPSVSPSIPPLSPALYTSGSPNQITIRNRLVKQAAWAYLQPMGSCPSSSHSLFPSTCQRIVSSLWSPFASCAGFISYHAFSPMVDCFHQVALALSRIFGL